MATTSLPFELDRDEIRGHHTGAEAVHGTIRLEGETIIVEFRLERSMTEGAPHAARIPLTELTKIMMTGGAVKSPRLVIDVSDDELLKTLPWADGHQCVVRFRRADGQRLREFIEEVEVRLAEIRMRADQQGDSS